MEDENCESTYSVKASDLHNHSFVVLNGNQCKIIVIQQNGDKVIVIGSDVFTNEQYEETFDAYNHVNVPNLTTKDYIANEVSEEGVVEVMNDELELSPFSCASMEVLEKIKKLINEYKSDDNEVGVIVTTVCGKSLITESFTIQK